MVILNLYPKGTLEYDDKEIRSTGTNNKAVIPYENIISIEFNEPTFFKNGMIKIKASNVNREIQCIFKKNSLDTAKIAYSEILELKEKHVPYEANNLKNDIDKTGEETENNENPNEFECIIREEKPGIFKNDRNKNTQNAIVTLTDNGLIINKASFWRNKDRGSKEILYMDITSVDLDLSGTFGITNYIEITLSGSNIITLENVNKEKTTQFFNKIKEEFKLYKINSKNEKENVKPIQQTSDADELIKWHQMMEQGIITQEEFELKKKELLGL